MSINNRLINTGGAGVGLTETLDIFGDGSCVAAYTFNGNVLDLSGNHNGTINGTVNYVEGKFGLAADFSAGFVSAPTTNLPKGQAASTMACWVSTNSVIAGSTGIMGYGNEASAQLRVMGFTNPSRFTYFTYGQQISVTSPTIPSDGTWTHVMVEDSGNSKTLYINGVSRNGGNWQNSTGSGDLKIGSSWLGGFGGKIDQVRIFNKLLNSSERQLLLTEGL